jgi:very-short-patch-repair endonuclease
MTLRNSLLNFRQRSRGVIMESVDSAAVYDQLVRKGKALGFSAAQSAFALDEDAGKRRSASSALTVPLTPEELQRRLLRTFYDARTLLEEQGVNTLFLALGYLEWYEADSSQDLRRAPLALVPVQLERSSARDSFVLRYSDDEVGDNLCLRRKLDEDFGVRLPDLLRGEDVDADEADLADYFARVRDAVRGQARWRVDEQAASLSFFSFAKFLMYHDLDPESWPAGADITDNAVLRALVVEGEQIPQPGEPLPDGAHIDDVVEPQDTHQVCDADSSQVRAIVAANRGLTMVIQGPPGTGKSQTITNIIAEAIGQGRTVLFVSEKMAALDVVKRRLDQLGLGAACLELHSHKTHKRLVLQELGRTLDAAGYERSGPQAQPERVKEQRDRLNVYERALHEPVGKTCVTPYQAMGEIMMLSASHAHAPLPPLKIAALTGWSPEDYARRHALVEEAQTLVAARGVPHDNPLWVFGLTECAPDVERRIPTAIKKAQKTVKALVEAGEGASRSDGAPTTRAECEPLTHVGANVFLLLSGKSRRARAELVGALAEHEAATHELADVVALDEKAAFGADVSLGDLLFEEQSAALAAWLDGLGSLDDVVAFNELRSRLEADKLGAIAGQAASWKAAGAGLVDAFELSWFTTLLDRALSKRAVLSGFVRETHESTVASFAAADMALLRANRTRLAREHLDRLPSYQSASGTLGLLRKEIAKKRRHIPLRQLLAQTGTAIQAIKPVFMMSPLSIATFLEQGGLDFDLVVFDEASQVRPVDAFGAILRGRQTIVVGDEMQLPPTAFFDAMTGGGAGEDEGEEEPMSADIQSVLKLFLAKEAPKEPLLWHYRSRHHSLIAFSNAEFYGNELVVFPHAEQRSEDLGLVYHYLPETVYGRGRTQRNPAETREVAEAVLDHARENPDETLGVAAFSASQMQAILDELETMRRLQPEYEGFFTAHPEEPFFVKNLENVQGDERDVIFISVGYGRDASGSVSMNFGPLNQQGGERRLNVLITRARRRCEVFTNLRADDIDLSRTNARGVQALKHFLRYAETQTLDEAVTGPPPTESPFESAVRDVLEDAGHQVDTQVGVAKYRVDLAVVDQQDPGRYVLGIECDGKTYHHARSARDRDRLRQAVLEQMGWRLYRIWSTDWFKHPEREAKRLLEAVEAARHVAGGEAEPERDADEPSRDEAQEPAQAFRSTVGAPRYKRAKVTMGAQWRGRLRDKPIAQLVDLIEGIVRVEQPVHFDAVVRRLAEAADQAAGPRVKERIKAACDAAVRSASIKRKGEFMWRPDLVTAPVRDRSKLPAAERSWACVSPMELRSAIQQAALASFGLEIDEAPRPVARLLGLARTPADVQSTIRTLIDAMVADGSLTLQDTCILAPDGTPSLLKESRERVESPSQPVQPVPSHVVPPQPKPVPPRPASTPGPPLDVRTKPAKPYVVTVLPPQAPGADLLGVTPDDLAPLIVAVCREESPVYLEHLFLRIATAYGLDCVRLQVGVRLRLALEFLEERGEVVLRGDFVWRPGQGPNVTCRSRAALAPDERVSAVIALEEIQSAILDVANERDVPEGALCLPVAWSLGFERADEEVTARILMTVKAMLEAGVLSNVGDGLRQVGAPVFLTKRSGGPGGAVAKAAASPPNEPGPGRLFNAGDFAASPGRPNAPADAKAAAKWDEDVAKAIEELQDRRIRRKAMDSLGHIGGRAVPALIQALRDPSVRLFAINVLAEIGAPAAKPLRRLELGNDTILAEAARAALDKMPGGGY